jgi:hypothetical protein
MTPHLTKWLSDHVSNPASPESLAGRARARRWLELVRRFPDIRNMRVLDLGGSPTTWRLAPVRPEHVTIVNIDAYVAEEPWITVQQADACNLSSDVLRQEFDLVYSNSLLEHVGGHARREDLAQQVHAAAPHHWVQTPYRYFPIEPHWMMPAMQFFPFAIRMRASQHWRYGHMSTPSEATAYEKVAEVELIGNAQMRWLFPESALWRERYLGMTKSLIAIQ